MTWRRAVETDALALMELEREASTVALGHVFPGPYPEDDVLARWALVLEDPSVVVEVVDRAGAGLTALTAYDDCSLRHLAVHPGAWGRGLARAGVERAVAAVGSGITLWCLEQNHRARGLYAHLGWEPTGRTQDCVWAPHPVELEYQWRGVAGLS